MTAFLSVNRCNCSQKRVRHSHILQSICLAMRCLCTDTHECTEMYDTGCIHSGNQVALYRALEDVGDGNGHGTHCAGSSVGSFQDGNLPSTFPSSACVLRSNALAYDMGWPGLIAAHATLSAYSGMRCPTAKETRAT